MTNGRIGVVIPALNEAENIADLVLATLAEDPPGAIATVVVVDNGSDDDTGRQAEAAGAAVVVEPRRGYGYACLAGTEAAVQAGVDIVVYLDADHSCRPDELGDVVGPIIDGDADLVLGSRTRGTIARGAMPPHQRFGNWLSARLMRRLYGIAVTDLGPYRAIRSELISSLDMAEMTFGWPTEMTVKTANRGARIVEVPVSWDQRRSGTSKVSGTLRGTVLAARHILGVTIRYARRRNQG